MQFMRKFVGTWNVLKVTPHTVVIDEKRSKIGHSLIVPPQLPGKRTIIVQLNMKTTIETH